MSLSKVIKMIIKSLMLFMMLNKTFGSVKLWRKSVTEPEGVYPYQGKPGQTYVNLFSMLTS